MTKPFEIRRYQDYGLEFTPAENHIFIKTKKILLPKCIRHMIFVNEKTDPVLVKAYPNCTEINKFAFILYENNQIAIEENRKWFDKRNLVEVCMSAGPANSESDECFLSKENTNWMQSEVIKSIFWTGTPHQPIVIFLKNNEQVLLKLLPPYRLHKHRPEMMLCHVIIRFKKLSQVHFLGANSAVYFDNESNTLQKISKFFEPNMSGILEWCGNESKTISEKGKILQQLEYDEQNKKLEIIYPDLKKTQICTRENSFLFPKKILFFFIPLGAFAIHFWRPDFLFKKIKWKPSLCCKMLVSTCYQILMYNIFFGFRKKLQKEYSIDLNAFPIQNF
jgi:hypothetical protein